MNVLDWRGVPPREARALYCREREIWNRQFHWETESTWNTVEIARTTWGLPGFVAEDRAGRITGWTFYMPEESVCQVGGLVSDSQAATDALIARLMTLAREGKRLSFFMADRAAALDAVCASHGITLDTHHYLERSLVGLNTRAGKGAPPSHALTLSTWRNGLVADAAALLRRAYGERGHVCAPGNTLAEWKRYVEAIVTHTACGELAPTLSRVVHAGTSLSAIALVSLLAERTAHLVQIAVEPSLRGQGVAGMLLREVMTAAAAHGCTTMTLMVADANLTARRLYEREGFRTTGRFVSAVVG